MVKAKSVDKENWRFASIMYLTSFLSLIFMSIFILVEKIFKIEVFAFKMNKIGIIIFCFIPALILNYLLVFYRKRYIYLLKNYEGSNGKYIIRFMLVSILMTLISIFY